MIHILGRLLDIESPFVESAEPVPAVRWPLWQAEAIVFVASACIVVLELVAGRIIAPYMGVSLYTGANTGSTVRRVSEAGTAGSIAGTFATDFRLICSFRTRRHRVAGRDRAAAMGGGFCWRRAAWPLVRQIILLRCV